MLFTLPGRHPVTKIDAATMPIFRFLMDRGIEDLANCRMFYSARTEAGMVRSEFWRPPILGDSWPDFLEDFLDRLKSEGTEEIFDMELLINPLRAGVLQITDIVFERRGPRSSSRGSDRFSLRFRDHPDAPILLALEAMMKDPLRNTH